MGQLPPLKDMRASSTGNTALWKMVALLPGALQPCVILQSDKILEPLEQELSCTLPPKPAPGKYQQYYGTRAEQIRNWVGTWG